MEAAVDTCIMKSFREFLVEREKCEEEKNLAQTLNKLPKGHAKLVRGYKWTFQDGNTLDGDDQHVGVIDDKKKKITVAAPWNYGREFTTLHEIAHKVWEKYMTKELRDEWSQVVKKNKGRMKQNDEELFCMAYANTYANQQVVVHTHPAWEKFIRKLGGS